ncbi:MAG: hypothetical protein R3C13_13250 [Hyphomonas sp.]|uniref:hypothetical protein n=1 Tax=Hyphomonas sp. TaxID=87 RepID=UPI00352903B4
MAEAHKNPERSKRIARIGGIVAVIAAGFAIVNAVNASQKAKRTQFVSDVMSGDMSAKLDLLEERCGGVLTGDVGADATVMNICEDMVFVLADYLRSADRTALSGEYSPKFVDAVFARIDHADTNTAGEEQ